MKLVSTIAVLALVFLVTACDKAASSPATPAASYDGQGAEVSADPTFEIKLKLGDGPEQTFTADRFAIYQTAPPKGDKPQAAQGWELRGGAFVIAGKLADDLKIAPQRNFETLIGKDLAVRSHGGDPTMAAMSKITLPDDKVFVARSGSVKVDKAFHRKGSTGYAGVSGTFEFEAQEIKLGDPDAPDNKGDQPVGSPVKATGTFTTKAGAFPFEQL